MSDVRPLDAADKRLVLRRCLDDFWFYNETVLRAIDESAPGFPVVPLVARAEQRIIIDTVLAQYQRGEMMRAWLLKARRIEARFPDPMANPYLAFSALMMAGLDGVENKIHPGEAATKDLYHLPPEEDALVPTVCHSLDQALEYLDKDRAFLTKGGVFTDSMIDAYIELKMAEVTRFRQAVHPIEYEMYYSL